MSVRGIAALLVITLLMLEVGVSDVLANGTMPVKTVRECVEIALQNHPSIKAAAASVQAGRQRVRQAASNYLPQVTALYSSTRSNISASARNAGPGVTVATLPPGTPTPGVPIVNTGPSTFNFYKTQVALSQILFDFGQTLNRIRSAQASEQSLQADLSTQADTVVLNVQQSYFNVLAARQLLGVANDTIRQDQKHLELAEGRFHVGMAPKFDVTNAEVQLANAELNQLTARNNVAVAWETLRNAMGVNGPLDFDIADVGQRPVAITEDQALAIAYENRPELQSIRAQELANTEDISALRKNYLPTVTGNGAYQWSGSDYPLQSGWMIGATVNMSVFNGWLTTAQIGEQKANLSNLKFNEELLRQSIALQVRQAVLNLQQAAQSIRVAEKGLQLSRENLALAEGRYSAGVGNIIELTDAQASLTTAQANYVQALYTYNTQLATLENAMAQDLVSD